MQRTVNMKYTPAVDFALHVICYLDNRGHADMQRTENMKYTQCISLCMLFVIWITEAMQTCKEEWI